MGEASSPTAIRANPFLSPGEKLRDGRAVSVPDGIIAALEVCLAVSAVILLWAWHVRGPTPWTGEPRLLREVRVLAADRGFGEAASMLGDYVHRHPRASASVRAHLGVMLFCSGHYREARLELEKVASRWWRDSWAEGVLACTLLRLGERREAERRLIRALERVSNDQRRKLLSWWATMAEDAAEFALATSAYEEIAARNPGDIWASYHLAGCMLCLGRTDGALERIKEALSQADSSEHAEILRYWSQKAWDAGQLEALAKTYEWMLTNAPSDEAQVLRWLALLRAAAPDEPVRDGPRAVDYAKRSCELEGWTNWQGVSVLAAAFAETGDFDAAVEYAKVAYRLAPPDESEKRVERIRQYEQRRPFRIAVQITPQTA